MSGLTARSLGTVDRLVRPVAKALDADKMAELGIRNTRRLAKAYNGLLYGRYERWRRALWSDGFVELAAEAGGSAVPRVRLQDGFAIDTSGSLPGLDDLLSAADEVIAERAGTPDVDDRYRAFFRNLLEAGDHERWPGFLDFAASAELIAIVGDHLGFVPALSGTLPPGVRMVESGRHLDADADLPPRDSQVFHIDIYDHPVVYVIVLVRDTTEEMGPFTFLPASVSAAAAAELDYWSRGRPYRLGDEEIYSVVDASEAIRFTYQRGTVLFVDPSQCFHFGARNGERPRFQVMYGFGSTCRADFSESYVDSFTYPQPRGQTRLRQIVTDRGAIGV